MKKKLIAAVTSLVMVATLAPATAFASTTPAVSGNDTTATRQAVNQEAVDAANAAIDAIGANSGIISYPDSGSLIKEAKDLYDPLTQEEKAAVGDAKAKKLAAAVEQYAGYTDKISEIESAFAAVTKLNPGDATDDKTAYGKALNLKETAVVNWTSYEENGTIIVQRKPLEKADVWNAVDKTTQKKFTDARAAYDVVGQIDAFTNTEIKADNYASTTTTDVTAAYNDLTPARKALVGNYGTIVRIDDTIADFKATVEAFKAYNTDAYKAAVNDAISTTDKATGIEQATKDVAALKAAFKALDAEKQAAVEKDSGLTATGKTLSATIEQAEDNIKAFNETVAAKEAGDAVIALIKALPAPGSIELKDGDAILNAEAAYEALSPAAKNYVKSTVNGYKYKDILDAAKTAYYNKVKAQEDDVRVAELTKIVNALPDSNAITPDDKLAVNEALNYFSQNTGTKGTDYAFFSAQGTLEGRGHASAWQKLFAVGDATKAIPGTDDGSYTKAFKKLLACKEVLDQKTVAETNNANNFVRDYLAPLAIYTKDYIGTNVNVLGNAKLALQNAKDEFAKLNSREQAAVEANAAYENIANIEKAIADAEKAIAGSITAKDIDALIDAIGIKSVDEITAETLSKYEAKIEAANTAYTLASKEAQDAVTDAKETLLKDAVAKVKAIKELSGIASVEEKIAALPVVKTDGTETEATLLAAQKEIKEVQAVFDALSASVQDQVSNASKLSQAKKALTDAATKLAQDEFAKIGNITAGITDEQVAQFNKVNAILDEFGLESAVIDATNPNPTYAKVKAAVEAKEKADVDAVKDGIKALPATVTKNNIADVYDLQNAYNALSDKQKEQITEAEKAKLDKAVAEADALSLAKAKIDAIADQTYTGNEINVDVVVKDVNGTVIPKDAYEVSYNDNKAVGTATVVVNAKADSKYAGTAKQTFEIVAASIEDATVTGIATKTYTGKALTQVAKVIVGDKTLALGTDYTVAYKNNTKVGKATMTITAQGNYKGELTKTFVVKPGKATVTSLKAGKKKATVKIKSIPGATTYKIAYKQRGNSYKYKTVKTTSLSKTITGLKSGKVYKVKVLAFTKIDGKTYYTGYSTIKTVKVK